MPPSSQQPNILNKEQPKPKIGSNKFLTQVSPEKPSLLQLKGVNKLKPQQKMRNPNIEPSNMEEEEKP